MIIRSMDGRFLFRVDHGSEGVTDYEIRHDDMSVTIDVNALAAFYRVGGLDVLDHRPEVEGLRRREER